MKKAGITLFEFLVKIVTWIIYRILFAPGDYLLFRRKMLKRTQELRETVNFWLSLWGIEVKEKG
jgi:hypothetical protein